MRWIANARKIFCLLGLVWLCSLSALAQKNARYTSFKPGEPWLDDKGVHINAHGGGMLYHQGKYYWFGEHKIAGRAGNVAHVGVHCYSSTDLYNWKDEGIALSVVTDNPASEIAKGRVIERPKVIYNRKTEKFVMWFHLEPFDRETPEGHRRNVQDGACAAVAVSDKVTGPYRFVRSVHPDAGHWPINVKPQHQNEPYPKERRKYPQNLTEAQVDSLNLVARDMQRGQQSRDMTLFVDDDGKAYHIYSSEENTTLHISELTDDYMGHTGRYKRLFVGRYMEAPAMFKHNGKYYLMMSGCTGWKPNEARSAVADSIFGEWRELGNPCVGADAQTTFHSQSTYILPVAGKKDEYIYMGDRWKANNAIDGRYIWLPIRFEDDRFTIRWHDEWRLEDKECFQTWSKEKFPDGSLMSTWFHDTTPSSLSSLGKQYVVTAHGVVNDSSIVQTQALQAVIDLAYKNGGGVVVIPKGTFLSGSLFLKPNVNLYLQEGGVLKGSDNIADFKMLDTRMEGRNVKYFAALVNVNHTNGTVITGKGTINGNGYRYWTSFWLRRQYNPKCTNMEELRPRLLFVSHSENMEVSGIRLIDSPFWTSHYYKCENVKILGVTLLSGNNNGYKIIAPSSDGIDLDVCHNVLVKGCFISVNDDGVCLKGGKGPLADKDPNNGENSNILIEDNTFRRCPVLTLGSESVKSRNVWMRRCKVDDVHNVLLFKMRPDTPQQHEYIKVENMKGTAKGLIEVSPWKQFFDLQGQPAPHSSISHIQMLDSELDCGKIFRIKSSGQYDFSEFTFQNLMLKTPQEEVSLPKNMMNGLQVKNVKVNGKALKM